MNIQKTFVAALLVLSFQTWATFIPENEIRWSSLTSGPSNMTEAEFRQNIARVQEAYAGIVSAHGGRLAISG